MGKTILIGDSDKTREELIEELEDSAAGGKSIETIDPSEISFFTCNEHLDEAASLPERQVFGIRSEESYSDTAQ